MHTTSNECRNDIRRLVDEHASGSTQQCVRLPRLGNTGVRPTINIVRRRSLRGSTVTFDDRDEMAATREKQCAR